LTGRIIMAIEAEVQGHLRVGANHRRRIRSAAGHPGEAKLPRARRGEPATRRRKNSATEARHQIGTIPDAAMASAGRRVRFCAVAAQARWSHDLHVLRMIESRNAPCSRRRRDSIAEQWMHACDLRAAQLGRSPRHLIYIGAAMALARMLDATPHHWGRTAGFSRILA
jgi:hypothetical protein